MLSSGIMHLKELHIRLEGQALPFYSNGEGEGLIPKGRKILKKGGESKMKVESKKRRADREPLPYYLIGETDRLYQSMVFGLKDLKKSLKKGGS